MDEISVPSKDQIVVHAPKLKVDLTEVIENQHFRLYSSFDETSSNDLVYKYTTKPLVQTKFEIEVSTCFAYGQTGSVKIQAVTSRVRNNSARKESTPWKPNLSLISSKHLTARK
jgi:hypothetical protein